MLVIDRLSVQINGNRILKDVGFECEPGKVTAIIGPNGAGKTTLFDAMTGFVPRAGGTVLCDTHAVPHASPHRVARCGLSRTFQTPRLFEEMTVLENLEIASQDGGLAALVRSACLRYEERRMRAEARKTAGELLEFLRLDPVRDNLTSDLSGGQRKLVELGRALMTEPRYVLLDEPVAGVAPALVKDVGARLRDLAAQGLGVLVIEHNMDFVMNISDFVIVMVNGEVLTQGSAAEVRSDPRVLAAYLGGASA
ncbi:Branched-chain amino acid transport system ATP-binding protein OS=Castellaniella defragrans OX=75697 GN=HNR28_001738 PE=4 SV=1 [Castellaniella defragrans]